MEPWLAILGVHEIKRTIIRWLCFKKLSVEEKLLQFNGKQGNLTKGVFVSVSHVGANSRNESRARISHIPTPNCLLSLRMQR